MKTKLKQWILRRYFRFEIEEIDWSAFHEGYSKGYAHGREDASRRSA